MPRLTFVFAAAAAALGCANALSTPESTQSSASAGASAAVTGQAGASVGSAGTSSAGAANNSPSAGAPPSAGQNGGASAGAPSGGSGSAAAGSAGAATAGTGGALGAGGAVSTCVGVPLTPNATGYVALASNSLGINGSWFEYSDCVDLKQVNCSTVTQPPAMSFPNTGGKLCTSGTTSTAANAWGAGIGLELNDASGQQPYDTVAHGVKGFCFTLSGATIPAGLRVAFTTQSNQDNPWFSAVSTPGQHSVLFSQIAQASWEKTMAWEPTKVMLVQFQIPASTTAALPWDFCIEGFTAITQ